MYLDCTKYEWNDHTLWHGQKISNQKIMVWLAFMTCLQGFTKKFISMTIVGNGWKLISNCFIQFLNKFKWHYIMYNSS